MRYFCNEIYPVCRASTAIMIGGMTDEPQSGTPQVPTNKLKAGWQLLKLTFGEWWNDDTFELSAALAFYTTFSIAPGLLIAGGIASFFLAPDTAENEIVSEIQKMVGPQGAHAIRQVIESSRGFGKGIGAVSVGIIAFIIGATAVFGELQAALNRIWDVKSKPDRGVLMPLMINRLRSFSIALCVGFLLLVSLVISALISGLQQYMNNWLPGIPWFWQTANVIASFVVVAVLFVAPGNGKAATRHEKRREKARSECSTRLSPNEANSASFLCRKYSKLALFCWV